jgi:hypothetical protein
VEGSIFEVAPDPGLWSTALLLDGNIGIGGHPGELLTRVGELLSGDGRVLVELDPAAENRGPDADAPIRVRIEADGTTSAWFPWARVTVDAIDVPAEFAGMQVAERWSDGGRHFCTLART